MIFLRPISSWPEVPFPIRHSPLPHSKPIFVDYHLHAAVHDRRVTDLHPQHAVVAPIRRCGFQIGQGQLYRGLDKLLAIVALHQRPTDVLKLQLRHQRGLSQQLRYQPIALHRQAQSVGSVRSIFAIPVVYQRLPQHWHHNCRKTYLNIAGSCGIFSISNGKNLSGVPVEKSGRRVKSVGAHDRSVLTPND